MSVRKCFANCAPTTFRDLLAAFAACLCMVQGAQAQDESKPAAPVAEAKEWTPLFNGKDLTGWKVTNFGGEGPASFEDGHVVITQGVDLSGITSTRTDLPRMNYEVEFEAQRALGNDFFAGFTFPVGKSSITLICGGWGGGVYGLSSLDGMDASENETTGYAEFKDRHWYKFRVKVTKGKIEAWMDDAQIVDVDTEGRKIDVRFEVELTKPMGFCTYQSTAWIRKARMRTLPVAATASEEKATP